MSGVRHLLLGEPDHGQRDASGTTITLQQESRIDAGIPIRVSPWYFGLPCLILAIASCGSEPQVREGVAVTEQFIAAAARADSDALHALAEPAALEDIARLQRHEPDLFAAMSSRMSINGSHVVTADSALIWFEIGERGQRDEVVATLRRVGGAWRLVQIGALPR